MNEAVAALKRLQLRAMPEGPQPIEANCDICGTSMPEEHRHLLQLEERSLMCVCESCYALRSGDAEFRPTGSRVVWLDGFGMPDELWARFGIPIGLAFFLRTTDRIVALYPSPAGATESDVDMVAWAELRRRNPELADMDSESEVLIVDRIRAPHRFAIAPTDEAYRLVGLVKANWQGISGGSGVREAVDAFFDELRERTA
jgi:hypothetical protein